MTCSGFCRIGSHISLWFNEVQPYVSLNHSGICSIPYENASHKGFHNLCNNSVNNLFNLLTFYLFYILVLNWYNDINIIMNSQLEIFKQQTSNIWKCIHHFWFLYVSSYFSVTPVNWLLGFSGYYPRKQFSNTDFLGGPSTSEFLCNSSVEIQSFNWGTICKWIICIAVLQYVLKVVAQ